MNDGMDGERFFIYCLLHAASFIVQVGSTYLFFTYVHWPFWFQWPVFIVTALIVIAVSDLLFRKIVYVKEWSEWE